MCMARARHAHGRYDSHVLRLGSDGLGGSSHGGSHAWAGRVHMAALGHAILGDALYAARDIAAARPRREVRGAQRRREHMLHIWWLARVGAGCHGGVFHGRVCSFVMSPHRMAHGLCFAVND